MNNKFRNFMIFVMTALLAYVTKIGCVFYKITGLYCPGCGLTRCVESLLKLDFYQAFRYNPLAIIYMIVLFIYFIVVRFIRKESFTISHISNKMWYSLVFITILYGICRNIDYFSWLAPIKIY